MRKLSKKPQLQTLAPVMIALVLAAVLLVFGLVMIQETRDTDVISKAGSASAVNETIATVTESGEILTNNDRPACVASVAAVTNATSGANINSGNYTVTGCTVFASDAGIWNNTNWNVSYSYTYGDEAWISSNQTISGMGTFADFWEIIVLAIVISIVIGLLLVVFGRPGTR